MIKTNHIISLILALVFSNASLISFGVGVVVIVVVSGCPVLIIHYQLRTTVRAESDITLDIEVGSAVLTS